MRESFAIAVNDQSQTGEARRASLALADRLGFQETERSNIGIVVTEIANNLVLHTHGGVILLREIEHHPILGIEILSLDKGPGMNDIEECLRDGFSTGGTSGNGLGAIGRLSDRLEIYSLPDKGTALLTRIWATPISHSSKKRLEIGAVCLSKRGEEVSGDAWDHQADAHRSLLLVADGLGHGLAAATASLAAVKIFQEENSQSPKAILESAHAALRSTRGAAIAIAEIDFNRQSVRFAGVGNISASIFSSAKHHNLVSHNGTVGHELLKIQEFNYPWYSDGLLVMHSDGLGTQWHLDRYPGLSQKHPSLIAGVLYRDFHRERDDVTVVVAKGVGA